jgi:protein-tyrosine phosphatase
VYLLSDQVKDFFEKYHAGHYRIYNVSGKHYDRAKLNNQVIDIGWPDHHSPTLEILITIVEIMSAWLDQDPANVVAIHCKVCAASVCVCHVRMC